jgi:hypothetical protein
MCYHADVCWLSISREKLWPCRCLATATSTLSTIPAFSRHVTILYEHSTESFHAPCWQYHVIDNCNTDNLFEVGVSQPSRQRHLKFQQRITRPMAFPFGADPSHRGNWLGSDGTLLASWNLSAISHLCLLFTDRHLHHTAVQVGNWYIQLQFQLVSSVISLGTWSSHLQLWLSTRSLKVVASCKIHFQVTQLMKN